ncbi:MAG: hypothetical protein H6581_28340 [Bacteroidia bacterium]|nr:hypothetical protein [Bacteroidia bacterium]
MKTLLNILPALLIALIIFASDISQSTQAPSFAEIQSDSLYQPMPSDSLAMAQQDSAITGQALARVDSLIADSSAQFISGQSGNLAASDSAAYQRVDSLNQSLNLAQGKSVRPIRLWIQKNLC